MTPIEILIDGKSIKTTGSKWEQVKITELKTTITWTGDKEGRALVNSSEYGILAQFVLEKQGNEGSVEIAKESQEKKNSLAEELFSFVINSPKKLTVKRV